MALGALVLVSAFFFRSERLALCRLGRMQGRLSERERIARELHDTLLQAVQALLLHLSVWEMDLPAEYQHGVAIALSRARATVVEGRNRIVMLRRTEPQTLDLLEELSRIADREALHPGPELRISAVGEPHPLRLELVEQLIDIAREAIRNGIRHARAQRIDVNVVYEKSRLVLHIVDDGLGIERAALQAAAAAAHFGLIGMQERAELLGGRLQISARQPRGTHIQVAVPTNSEAESGAFETPYGRPWQRMLGVSLSTL
jgi:signal transduction histidine kinase